MSNSVQSIIETELQDGEELLWSHVVSQGTKIETPSSVSGLWRVVQPIIFIVYTIFLLYRLKEIPSERLGDMLKQQLPIFVAFGIVLWFFTKTVIGKKLQAQSQRPIFQNGIITDKRILLFNHSEKRAEFSLNDIKEAGLDYENGGHALRISSRSKKEPSVLIGIADFKAALNIIKSHFLAKD